MNVPACALDHIVVAAASLDEGARYIAEQLGVEVPLGGRHETMGTHNRLMRIGEASYLEIIAIDPDGQAPKRPRWYALDDPAMRAKLEASPRLITWVARSADIVATVQAAAFPLGVVTPVSRGALSWHLSIPDDGHLPGGGVIPHVIEWDGGARPWQSMADPGCRLLELVLAHPDPDWLADALKSICPKGFAGITIVVGTEPGLSAKIRRPDGVVATL
jgi:Glyoxalase-like domain